MSRKGCTRASPRCVTMRAVRRLHRLQAGALHIPAAASVPSLRIDPGQICAFFPGPCTFESRVVPGTSHSPVPRFCIRPWAECVQRPTTSAPGCRCGPARCTQEERRMHITEAITTAARMGWRTRLVAAVLADRPAAPDRRPGALRAERGGPRPGSTRAPPTHPPDHSRPTTAQRRRPSVTAAASEHSLHDRNSAHHRRPGGPAHRQHLRRLLLRLPSRASRVTSTTRAGCGRRATSMERWRSSPASTWRRRNPTRRAGRTPSGSTSHGGASPTAGRSSTALTRGRAAVLAPRRWQHPGGAGRPGDALATGQDHVSRRSLRGLRPLAGGSA